MLHLLGEAGRVPVMLRLLAEMLRAGVVPDAATFTTVMLWLARAGNADGAMRVWAEMKARSHPTVVSYTACVKILFDAGRAAEARTVFGDMVAKGLRPTCKIYTVLIEHLADAGKFEAALDIMDKMQEAEKNAVNYTALMNAYFQSGKVDDALNLPTQMTATGISACCGTYEVLIHGLQKRGRKRESEHY